MIIGEQVEDPISVFLYALKAPETKRQYPSRLKVFLDYLKLEGTLEQQAKEFLSKAKQNPQWAQNSLMQFITFQKERVITLDFQTEIYEWIGVFGDLIMHLIRIEGFEMFFSHSDGPVCNTVSAFLNTQYDCSTILYFAHCYN